MYCSGNCLGLTVGVKNDEKKKEKALDFTIQNPMRMVFRLDVSRKELKSWAHKTTHVIEKKVSLQEDINSWTPFIRVKGVGVSIFLTDITPDP